MGSEHEAQTFQGIAWRLVFFTACNLLWYCRNLFVFENQTNAHSSLACRVLLLAKDYNQNLQFRKKAMHTIPSVTIKQISWKPPPHPWIKVNTDDSVLGGLETASCRGIMCNHEGVFKAAWSINLGKCSITMAEFWGVFWALCISRNMGY